MLMSLDREHTSVFTIEDPVEYVLDGVAQLQIRPAKGVTFATAARAVLRQDPDVVLIGEIRDLGTVHLAVQMSLTGHLVFSSLHASTAPGAVQRLIDMGTEPFLVRQTIAGVISPRLVRTLCRECRQAAEPDPSLLPPSAADFMRNHPGRFYVPKGCDACGQTGYRGRTTIQEVLAPTPEFLEQVRGGITLETLRLAARDAGMRTMVEDGILKAAQGITSLAEVIRVTYGGPGC
jgi:type II secretory ATPase GspE/PulE/Tfp pilus assembly ATPase PilB-like protein